MSHQNHPLRLKPWFALTDEERSYIVLEGYRKHVLKPEEVKPIIRNSRLNNMTNVAFPFVAFPLSHIFLAPILRNTIFKRSTWQTVQALNIVFVGCAWYAYHAYNPFYARIAAHREKLLDKMEERIGWNLLDLNDVLPRTWTTTEIHRQLAEVYRQRHSMLTNVLWPGDEFAEPIVDMESWPKKNNNKIQK